MSGGHFTLVITGGLMINILASAEKYGCYFRYVVLKLVTMLDILTHWGLDKMADTLADDIFKNISMKENFWILN